MNKPSVQIWDLPTRLFHWFLVTGIAFSVYSGLDGDYDLMEYHMISGYCVLTLILFRIGWGVVGSETARFSHFIKGPVAVMTALRHLTVRKPTSAPGHNPLGAISIVVMLTLLLLQVTTGLFANDDILLEGPLSHLVSYDVSRQLTGIHHLNLWFLGGMISLHLLAIAFHQFYKRDGLIIPMITGRTPVIGEQQPRMLSPLAVSSRAILLLVLCAGIVYGLVRFT